MIQELKRNVLRQFERIHEIVSMKHRSYFEVRLWSSFSSSVTATAALFCPINV